MTKVKAKQKTSFAEFASQMARNPETLLAFQGAMADAQRKREIGERIGRQRDLRGLTQPQVVERLGMKPDKLRKYQYWEEGDHLPGVEILEQIADVVGCSFDYLMTGGEQAPPAKDILKRLDRIERKLDRILEERLAGGIEDELGPDEDRGLRPKEGQDG